MAITGPFVHKNTGVDLIKIRKTGKAVKNYRKRLVRSTVIRDGAGSVGSDSFGAALK